MLVALIAMASSTIMVKIAEVQLLELILLGYLPIALLYLARNRYVITFDDISKDLSIRYSLLFVAILFLAILDLRLQFYPPLEMGLLKGPIIITLSRVVELLLAVFALLYLSNLFKNDLALLRYSMRWFYYCGVASALFALVSLPLQIAANLDLGAYGDAHRLRGFFNEGGPYGVYLIGIVLVGFQLKQKRWIKNRTWILSTLAVLAAFIGSQSKAADVAIIVVIFTNITMASRLPIRLSLLAALGALLLTATFVFDLSSQILIYTNAAEQFEALAAQNPEDTNLVVGRVAGLVIVPRMIAAHPLTGIGFGNYALMRNDPQYRGNSPYVKWYDSPGLGFLGYAPEFGLPLLLYFTYLLAVPYLYARSQKSTITVQNMALYPLISVLFGAQLNLYYPWIVAAFAIAAAAPIKLKPAVTQKRNIPLIAQ